MSTINPGDLVTVKTDPPFSSNGTPADPTTVKLVWRRRGSPPTTWVYGTDTEVVRDSAGTFHASIPIDRPGKYYFRWVGTGAVTAAEENSFDAVTNFP
jgi:hypothetical protein